MRGGILIAVSVIAACWGAVRGEAPAADRVPAADEVLAGCRAMLPVRPVELCGTLVQRSRKGIAKASYAYTLVLDRTRTPSRATVEICARGTTNRLAAVTLERPGALPEGQVMGTDVSWLDLSLDYLWWLNPRYDGACEGESIHGQTCRIIRVDPPAGTPGVAGARLWTDKKSGCLLQVEALDAQEQVVRRIWGTRIKKFGTRWMANVLETETPGGATRTKITVEEIREL